MNTTNNGGPAFPASPEHGLNTGMPGMTLRDYFAAKAMQGFLTRPGYTNVNDDAAFAYDMADAMLKAREVK